ncbi:translation initiation factor IF-2 [Sphingosinicella sp.]|uniref:translation initiation factor IF-2 n=1 Tax=Sphingosinicella sp. TaxID=1917971 RepID=UPI001854980B|nr:translation initiation factor IF-2 [Sphingosinicella sp.]MBA4758470.1 translation initiation factor IF-2 [Sphingosinicella sp.]MEA3540247.1 translation initiation factor IF-2 [Pseudomonadota bacterium]
MSDDNKPKLGARAPLGIKRTVDVGKVKQSFSHGRTKSVVVEVKRRRVLGRPDGAPEETPVVEAAPEAPAPVAAPPKPAAEAPKPRPVAAPNDLMSRQERQAQLLREAEEARLQMLEDQRRREEATRAEAAEAERRRAEEKRREEEAREAAPAAPEPAPAPEPEAVSVPVVSPPAAKREVAASDDDNGRGVRRGPPLPVRKETPKPARGRGDDHRRSGKLTVTRALEGDENGRARSLAALRRAREKERRAHIGGANQAKQVRDVVVPEAITVQELANRMAEKGADLVKALFKMGSMATINTTIDQDTAELLVTEFGHNIKRVSDSDVEIGLEGEADNTGDLLPRPPVVTIMGHVDHGKTSLLDALRGTDVVSGEAGGITQHIGAYQVKVATGDIVTFLDTPGHEAFTEMRGRGANVTDIVVLVVAGDDGLKPQSIEAISHTKAAGVPMIVAINKCDKPGSKPQKVREELLQHEVVVEDMGGDVQDVEVSALKKTNLDKLLDAILLQAELLELKANPNRPGEGTVIEAKLDKGRGPVATVLVSRGTVRVGDIFVVGAEWGKVRALVDDRGVQVKEAGPSKPVEVLGLSGTPMAGDVFAVVENEARAREIAAYRASVVQRKRTTQAPANLETMFSALKEKQALEYPLIVKGDVQGSVEAIVAAVNKISTDDIKARVLHSGVGGITESDVTLAGASGAPIIGFGVRANAKAREIAEQRGVALKYYDVIYDLVDDVKAAMAGQLGPEKIEHVVGRAEIREVFQAGKHGKAAGLLVLEGVIRKALKARVMRDDVIIYNGAVASLRRFKDDVAEVRAGLECGVTLENTTDIKAGDFLETFEVEERERTL